MPGFIFIDLFLMFFRIYGIKKYVILLGNLSEDVLRHGFIEVINERSNESL